mgnify:CR=1 FL=1
MKQKVSRYLDEAKLEKLCEKRFAGRKYSMCVCVHPGINKLLIMNHSTFNQNKELYILDVPEELTLVGEEVLCRSDNANVKGAGRNRVLRVVQLVYLRRGHRVKGRALGRSD